MAKFKTWVEGEGHDGEPIDTTAPLQLPTSKPTKPSDVPTALRWSIHDSHLCGVSRAHLAEIYEMPRAWIEMFVADPGKEL